MTKEEIKTVLELIEGAKNQTTKNMISLDFNIGDKVKVDDIPENLENKGLKDNCFIVQIQINIDNSIYYYVSNTISEQYPCFGYYADKLRTT